MRILIPCSGYGRIYRGIETWVEYLSKEFVKKGIEVYIVCGKNSKKENVKKITLLKFPILKRESLLYKQRPFEEISSLIESATLSIFSFQYLKKIYFDAVISPQWSDPYLFPLLKKSKSIFCFQSSPRKLTKVLYLPLLFDVADEIVSVSYFVKENVKKILGLNSKVIYNGVDIEFFHPMKICDKDDFIVLLYVGALLKKKGIYTLINVFKKLDPSNFKLLIVGEGPERKNIERLIKSEKLMNIKLIGKVSHKELRLFYNLSDIVIIPSEYPEALPLVTLEAMACGKPIIASNVGGLSEIVKKSNSGLIFESGDECDLIKKILELKESKKRKILGKNGRKFAEKELDWSKIAKKYIKLIEG